MWVAYQDNSQIESLYGRYKARTIRNNMLSKVFRSYWISKRVLCSNLVRES